MAAWLAMPIDILFDARILDSVEEAQARGLVRALMVRWTEVGPNMDVREGAGRALLLHPLRAADSLQLAAALVWAKRQPAGHHFVCLDQ